MSAQVEFTKDMIDELAWRIEAEPHRALVLLDDALRVYPGHRLFTILALDWARNQNRRIYTSEPAAYPCGGAKPLLPDGEFFREVVLGNRCRICPDREACKRAFPDFDLIGALGCESAVNVPVRRNGQTVGSLNLLHEAYWYRPEMAATLMRVADLAAPFLP